MKKLTYPLGKAWSLMKQIDPTENILLFSEPRGGSTWLAQIIGLIPETAVIWEPINPKVYKVLREQRFGWRQYIPQGTDWPPIERFFFQILRGRKASYHTLSHTSLWRFVKANRLIVKFCRGNALLPWLTQKFSFVNKPLYFVRHPFAVISSQIRHGAWDDDPDRFVIPNSPFNDRYKKQERFLRSLTTKEEALVARWCLANKVALEHGVDGTDWIRVHYERMVREPNRQLQRIFDAWNIPTPEGVLAAVRRPSATVKDGLASRPDQQLSKWQREFEPQTLERMQAVLDHFGIHIYSSDSLDPVESANS